MDYIIAVIAFTTAFIGFYCATTLMRDERTVMDLATIIILTALIGGSMGLVLLGTTISLELFNVGTP